MKPVFRRELYQFKFVYYSKANLFSDWSETVTFVAAVDMYRARELFVLRIRELRQQRQIYINYRCPLMCFCLALSINGHEFSFKGL